MHFQLSYPGFDQRKKFTLECFAFETNSYNFSIFQVKNFGFVDCWTLAGKPDPIKTCRFKTHIDYIYAATSLFQNFKLISVQHIDDNASDHNMVIATFNKKD